ncbi:MAG: hypothetical protein ACRDY1_06515, partial [Acidimicrobiales bacterium]
MAVDGGDDRPVLVVIGVGGMGLAIARRLGPGTVVLSDVDAATLEGAADVLRAEGHEVRAERADAADGDDVAGLADTAAGLGGPV